MVPKKVCVGVITKPFGVRGQVKIRPYTSSPDFFVAHTKLLSGDNSELRLRKPRIDGAGGVIAWIEGIHDRTGAERFRLHELCIARDELQETDENEYYCADLVGLNLVDGDDRILGVVNAVHDYGAGAFLEIELPERKVGTVPFNKDSIRNVNLKSQTIAVNRDFLLV